MYIYPDNAKLQYSGRIDWEDEKAPKLVFTASYVRMRFTGSSIKVKITNYKNYWINYMGVILDGKQTKFALKDDALVHTYVIAENMKNDMHELMLFKRMDGCHVIALHEFEVDDGAILGEVEPLPKRRMEVFGDSVSCGEVSEAIDYVAKPDPQHDGEFSNSWYSYSWMTARAIGAELHDTSQGGMALMDQTGWFCGPDFVGMESCYDKITYNPQCQVPIKSWDFSIWQPQLVVVAIGQNDSNPEDYMAKDYHCPRAVLWRNRYQAFLERILQIYPGVHIISTTTILGHDPAWDKAIDEVVTRMNNPKVTHFLYQKNGCGTPGHIRIPEAEKMAEELSSYIEQLSIF